MDEKTLARVQDPDAASQRFHASDSVLESLNGAVIISVRTASSFVDHVRVGGRCGISILSEQQRRLAPHFAGQLEREVVMGFREPAGTPLIEGSLAEIVTRVVDTHPAGDQLLHIAQIEHLAHGPEAHPRIFFSGRCKQIHAHDPAAESDAVDEW